MNAQNERIRVAIIGAGIGGLTLSAALHEFDHTNKLEINLYEGAHQISEVGAGIGMWPRTWKIMKELKFVKPLREFLTFSPDDEDRIAWQLRKADQPQGIQIQDLMMKGHMLGFHRADLQDTLLRRTNPESVHIKKRLTSFEERPNGEVVLKFQDGTSTRCDVLIGMDGIKSVVRKGLPDSIPQNPVWTGSVAYRGLVTAAALRTAYPGHRALSTPMIYFGKLKHVVVFPVQHKDGEMFVNVAAYVHDVAKENTPLSEAPAASMCLPAEILAAFTNWEPELQALIQCIKQPMKWSVGELIPLGSYSSSRVFIGGDAAHAMPPHLGSGAGQAIEDAYILANLLCHPQTTNHLIPKIGEIYNAIRQPEGNRVLNASIRVGKLYQLLDPQFEHVQEGDTEKLQDLADAIRQLTEWTWEGTVEADLLGALDMLNDAAQAKV